MVILLLAMHFCQGHVCEEAAVIFGHGKLHFVTISAGGRGRDTNMERAEKMGNTSETI